MSMIFPHNFHYNYMTILFISVITNQPCSGQHGQLGQHINKRIEKKMIKGFDICIISFRERMPEFGHLFPCPVSEVSSNLFENQKIIGELYRVLQSL